MNRRVSSSSLADQIVRARGLSPVVWRKTAIATAIKGEAQTHKFDPIARLSAEDWNHYNHKVLTRLIGLGSAEAAASARGKASTEASAVLGGCLPETKEFEFRFYLPAGSAVYRHRTTGEIRVFKRYGREYVAV